MNDVAGTEHVEKEFLVVYDYGMGVLWGIGEGDDGGGQSSK